MICLSKSLLAVSLVKITLVLQNVSSSDLVESVLGACLRKVPFSDEFLPEEPCLGKLAGATLLSRLGLLEKLIIRRITVFCGEGPGERAAISLYLLT